MNAVELQLLANCVDFLAEHADGPVDRRGPVGFAAADLVVEDNRTSVRQLLEWPEIVVRRARPAVQREQRNCAGVAIARNAVPRAVAAKIDVVLFDYHSGCVGRALKARPTWFVYG